MKVRCWRKQGMVATVAVGVVLFLHGALPFLAIPTLGQAVWTTGFSQSFANQSLLAAHAVNFGAPTPAPIAFGLSGAYPAAILIRLGLHPANAYSLMVALWLVAAFHGAWRLARRWGATHLVASLGAVLWLTSPMVLGHAGYSMLSLGMALLPLYFLAATGLQDAATAPRTRRAAPRIASFWAACLVSVFMDGYTFVMFAFGVVVWWAWQFSTLPALRRKLAWLVLPAIATGFGVAYLAYVEYVGRTGFNAAPIDVFRAWGLDLAYLVIPSHGSHGLFDLMGWSIERSEATQFGDQSVWATTFSLPLMVAAFVAFLGIRKPRTQSGGYLLIAVLGLYLALGPSWKVNTSKPPVQEFGYNMPESLAGIPTGNAWASEHLPGFNSMRASYRWSALGVFGLWAVLMLWAGQKRHPRPTPALVLLAVVVLNAPDIRSNWQDQRGMRAMFLDMDAKLLGDVRSSLRPGERTAFLPYANDFLVNHLAAASGIRAYNIGGDKNLELARQAWPERVQALPMGQLTPALPTEVVQLLLDKDADVVVLPYFDTLWAAHFYPCPELARARLSPRTQAVVQRIPGFECPATLKARMAATVQSLEAIPQLHVNEREMFSTVRLAAGTQSELQAAFLRPLAYPIRTSSEHPLLTRALWRGWHAPEPSHVWSTGSAQLRLPAAPCQTRRCNLTVQFSVFGAGPEQPIEVDFRVPTSATEAATSITVRNVEPQLATIALDGAAPVQVLDVKVPAARSPAELGLGTDPRQLGIALMSVDLQAAQQDSQP